MGKPLTSTTTTTTTTTTTDSPTKDHVLLPASNHPYHMKFWLVVLLLAWPSTQGFLFFPFHKTKSVAKLVVAQKQLTTAVKVTTGVALSGAALAFWLQQRQSQAADLVYTVPPGSLQGQTIVITGASTGLGLETAKRLTVGQPERIILTVRSASKGDDALADLQSYLKGNNYNSNNTTLSYKVLDLDDLTSVQNAVANSWTDVASIDCLVNNAGIMAVPTCEQTVDGIERQMQSNHLGHFVLTALLAPKLSRQARIINVSSEAHLIARFSGMDFNYCWTGQPGYGAWRSYGQSKLANILFTQELQRRVDDTQGVLDWKVCTLHPGAVATDLGRYIFGLDNWRQFQSTTTGNLLASAAAQAVQVFLKTVEQGASTSVYLAASGTDDATDPRGRYFVDCKPLTLNGFARNATAAKQLWEESEEKSGVVFSLTDLVAARMNETTATTMDVDLSVEEGEDEEGEVRTEDDPDPTDEGSEEEEE